MRLRHQQLIQRVVAGGHERRGNAQDLLLLMCGRRLPAGRLRGEPSSRFTDVATV